MDTHQKAKLRLECIAKAITLKAFEHEFKDKSVIEIADELFNFITK
jgi:hypothetical protein